MRLFLHAITILIIQIGIFAWYQLADFNNSEWVSLYYVWDKSILVLLILCCINPCKTVVPLWILIGTFFAIRLLCEFFSLFFEIGKFLTQFHVMFLINLLCILYILINQIITCQRLKL